MIREDFPPRRATPERPAGLWAWFVWAFFGNVDDGALGPANWACPLFPKLTGWRLAWGFLPLPVFVGVAGSDQWPRLRALCWWVRNPFHNLFFYVIGIADRPREFYSTREWGSPGWTFHAVRWGWLWLPFVSFKGWCNFYIGWRPYGAFGLKFNFAK